METKNCPKNIKKKRCVLISFERHYSKSFSLSSQIISAVRVNYGFSDGSGTRISWSEYCACYLEVTRKEEIR
jgi:hypothetical protein